MSSKQGYAAALSLLVACGVGALTGCTSGADDPPATGNGTAVTGATTTASPNSSPPTTTTTSTITTSAAVQIPEAARAHTKAGAEAFVRFFVEQSNVASMTADISILPALSDPSCKSCGALQGAVAELKAKGRHYATEPVSVSRVKAIDGAPAGQQFVRLQLVQNLADVVDASGTKVSTDPEAKLARTTSLKWMGDKWLVFGIAQ
ncbi:DUF6318 family protein [Pedococcus sp. P5_B7]